MKTRFITAIVTGSALLAGAAVAQTTTTVLTGSLAGGAPIVAGPGADFAVVAELPGNTPFTVDGCNAAGDWCQISAAGATGWIRADALSIDAASGSYVLSQRPADVTVRTIETTDNSARNGAAGGLAGAAAGAAVGGPVGAAVGAVVGSVGGAGLTEPSTEVTTYVTSNPVAPVVIPSAVEVGAVLPDTVVVTPVPESDFGYVYVDSTPVVVDADTRTVVRVVN